jgi:hypothetical protein
MRSALSRRRIACVALAAMLFSAVSPAIAAALFSGRAEMLGRMLALPPAVAATLDARLPQDDCHQPEMAARDGDAHSGHHGSSGGGGHDDSGHAAHGVFCSFCLAASSAITLPSAATAAGVTAPERSVLPPAEGRVRPASQLPATRHPRDPPSVLN